MRNLLKWNGVRIYWRRISLTTVNTNSEFKVKKCVDLYKFKAQKSLAKSVVKASTGATLAAGSVPTPASPALLLAGTLLGISVPLYESMSKVGKWIKGGPNLRKKSVSDLFDLVKGNNSEAVELCKTIFINDEECSEINQSLELFNEDVEAARQSFINRVMEKTK